MKTFQDLFTAMHSRPSPHILVIGDIMLDVYETGPATRISPEAAVPIILNPTRTVSLGGAGAVAAMCRALGATVDIVGDIGTGGALIHLLKNLNIQPFCTTNRLLTTKTRICGMSSGKHRQQICRIDYEDTEPFDKQERWDIDQCVNRAIREQEPDIILIADYDKGVCHCNLLLPFAVPQFRKTIVDPPKSGAWAKYRGASCIVPNRLEMADYGLSQFDSDFNLHAAIVKLDEDGCDVITQTEPGTTHIPGHRVDVNDVCGAGDNFLAALGLARAYGTGWPLAAAFANLAGGLQVTKHGVTPVTLRELMEYASIRGVL